MTEDPLIDPKTIEPNLFPSNVGKSSKKKKVWVRIFLFLCILISVASFVFFKGILSVLPKAEGKVRAERELVIQAKTEGFLKKIYIADSERMKQGESLFEFQNDHLGLELDQAMGDKQKIEINMNDLAKEVKHTEEGIKRAQVLFENGIISRFELEGVELKNEKIKSELDRFKKELEEADLKIKTLQNEKDSLQIKAPYDGVFLGELQNKEGNFFKKGETLGIFFSPDKFYLEADVLERDAARIKIRDRAEITLNAFNGVYPGEIVDIEEKAYQKIEKVYNVKNVVRVKISLNQFPAGLRPGMKGEARILKK